MWNRTKITSLLVISCWGTSVQTAMAIGTDGPCAHEPARSQDPTCVIDVADSPPPASQPSGQTRSSSGTQHHGAVLAPQQPREVRHAAPIGP
jgi:hypothetical protein